MDEAQNLGHVRVALLHEADALRSPETRGGGLITLAPAFEFLEGPIWPHFGRPQSGIHFLPEEMAFSSTGRGESPSQAHTRSMRQPFLRQAEGKAHRKRTLSP